VEILRGNSNLRKACFDSPFGLRLILIFFHGKSKLFFIIFYLFTKFFTSPFPPIFVNKPPFPLKIRTCPCEQFCE